MGLKRKVVRSSQVRILILGVSPNGKAIGFDPTTCRFDSYYPCLREVNKMYVIERYPKDVLEHAIRVSKLASEYGKDYETLGLLHDILEDTNTDIEEIPEELRNDLITLTHFADETYFKYIERIKKGSERAIKIKLCDIQDHLDNKETLKPSLEKRYLKAKELLLK